MKRVMYYKVCRSSSEQNNGIVREMQKIKLVVEVMLDRQTHYTCYNHGLSNTLYPGSNHLRQHRSISLV